MSCGSLWAMAIPAPYSNYLCCVPDMGAVGTILNVFSYDAVLGQDSKLSHHLPNDERMGYMFIYSCSWVRIEDSFLFRY